MLLNYNLTKGVNTIELVVIRDIAGSSLYASPFYSWLKKVVEVACSERRNVRVSMD